MVLLSVKALALVVALAGAAADADESVVLSASERERIVRLLTDQASAISLLKAQLEVERANRRNGNCS